MLAMGFVDLFAILLVMSLIASGTLFLFLIASHLQQPGNDESSLHGHVGGTMRKEPARVLDELAEALHVLNGKPGERQVATSLRLNEQFAQPIRPEAWGRLERSLGCTLPALKPAGEDWEFPEEWTSVADLATYVSRCRTDWVAPSRVTLFDWREAQIFAGVSRIVSEQLSIPLEEISRSDRFVEDLHAD